jgi:Flp pilus assembly protein TadG
MLRNHSLGAFFALLVAFVVGSAIPALAQGWGEQAPLQFKYINQGVTNEVYRNQLGTTAAAASSSSSLGSGSGSGLGQASSQLNNAVQLNENNTYNVTITGDGNYLNVTGSTVNAQQTSTGTKQTTTNSLGTSGSPRTGSSPYLN